MSVKEERVFIIGASGDIGSGIIRGLVNRGVKSTAYARNEDKTKGLFKEELATGLLTIAVGDYSTMDVYENAVKGHTRLFILLLGDFMKPALMSQLKEAYGKVAYQQGVRQIVDLSSFSVRAFGMQGVIAYIHTSSEDKLWALAEENSEQRSIVFLRPAFFMTNHFMGDIHHIKRSNKILSCGSPSTGYTWIDTKDIADCAVVILTDPVEKHDRLAYEMGGEHVSHEQRAALFSKILGRSITYEQVTPTEFYKMMTSHGLTHSLAYDLVSYAGCDKGQIVTPQLSILIKRPLRTLEEWIKENANAFS